MKFYFHICNTHDISNNKLWKATLCSISWHEFARWCWIYMQNAMHMCAKKKLVLAKKYRRFRRNRKEKRKTQNDTDIVLFWCEEMQKTSFTLLSLRKGKKCVRQESASVSEQHEQCTAANDTQNMNTKCWNFQYLWCTEFEHKNPMSKQASKGKREKAREWRERERDGAALREWIRSHSSQLSNKLIWVLSCSILYAISCLYLLFLLAMVFPLVLPPNQLRRFCLLSRNFRWTIEIF